MKDIVAVGEVLIDLTQKGVDELGVGQYAANPGGAPANLAVAAARLGASTAFVGKVGRDAFGKYLRAVLEENNVDTTGLLEDAKEHTTLAVVSVDETGERSFSFYRDPSADVNLRPEEIPAGLLKETRILHFGSVSLTAEPARSATLHAAKTARANGCLVSYDPNYRASLWSSEEEAIREMKNALPLCDILKISDEELPLLTGTTDPETGSAMLSKLGIRLVFITLGANGAFFRLGEQTGSVPGIRVKVGDTNGAGDTFFGAALSKLVKENLDELTLDHLAEIAAFANKAASITTSRHGAIPAMPRLEEVE
ncbi:MAG: carbohydrate kinase [Faecousia sp.]